MVVLGSGLYIKPDEPTPPREEVMLEGVQRAVLELKDALNSLPPPEVHVSAPDLSEIVSAVLSLRPSAGPEEIAASVARAIHIPLPDSPFPAETMARLADLLEKLEFRLQGSGGGGGGGPSNDGIHSRLDTLNANVSSSSSRVTRAIKFEPSAGEEVRRDETTTDDYHGLAADGTAEGTAAWDVVRFYKTSGKIVRVRFRSGISWTDRATGWS